MPIIKRSTQVKVGSNMARYKIVFILDFQLKIFSFSHEVHQ